jgi:hypothetical protein
MTFLQRGNRHDSWQRFCATHLAMLAPIGLPEAIIHGEDRFRDLLRVGAAAGNGVEASLADLSAEQWMALERFAAVFFHECESYAPLELFPAFQQEVRRRGAASSCVLAFWWLRCSPSSPRRR